MIRNFINILTFVILAAFSVSCTKSLKDSGSREISFSLQMADETKAAGQFTASTLSSLSEFKVTGYDGSTKVIDNRTAYKNNSAWEFNDNPISWISGHTMTFFANANMPSWASAVSNSSTTTTLTITQIPSAVNDQWDPLIGYYKGTGDNGNAAITFHHPLAAVVFKTGDLGAATYNITGITSVKINGVHKSGTATITGGSSSLSYNWTPSGTTSVTGAFSGTQSAKPFLLIPQNLATNNVTLEITVSRSSGGAKTMYATVESGQWLAGKTNTYVLDYINNQFGESFTVTVENWGTVTSSSSEHPDYFDANYD